MLRIVSFDPMYYKNYLDGKFLVADLADKDEKPSEKNCFVLLVCFADLYKSACQSLGVSCRSSDAHDIVFWGKAECLAEKLLEHDEDTQRAVLNVWRNDALREFAADALAGACRKTRNKKARSSALLLMDCAIGLVGCFIRAKETKATVNALS